MELEQEEIPRLWYLMEKQPLCVDFENRLYGVERDRQYILTEFVDWNCVGPTYSFNELRDLICAEAKHSFNKDAISILLILYLVS